MDFSIAQEILARIPGPDRTIDTTTLHASLQAGGHTIILRRLQRLLRALEGYGLIQEVPPPKGETRPCKWSWVAGRYIEYPPLSAETALSVVMAHEHLRNLLPPTTLKLLEPRVSVAQKVLSKSTVFGTWQSKVRVRPRGLPLLPPPVDPSVARVVYKALLSGKQFNVQYLRRGKEQWQHYNVNPLAIVVRGGVVSLVSTRAGTNTYQQLHLHRMRDPEQTPNRVALPPGFKLDEYLAAGNLAFKLSPAPVKLELLVSKVVAQTLTETPLSTEQTVEVRKDKRFLVCATLPDTMDLRGWIKSYGPLVEVVGPNHIRAQIAKELRKAARQYK